MKLTDFSGARRIPLVGRRNLLHDAEQRIRRGGVHLIYCEGEGGIGKTALLEAILDEARRASRAGASSACVAEDLIDLYHADVHTPEGLIRCIIQVLGERCFAGSQAILEALDKARAVGDADVTGQRVKELHETFLSEFAALAERGIVLAFDTLEILDWELDPYQAELGLGDSLPLLSVGEWLITSFIPVLTGNVVVLFAGRPSGLLTRLRPARARNPRLQVRHLTLAALRQEEVAEYLKVVAHLEAEQGDADAAARLWNFCETRADVTHYLTGGRPILLALVADVVARGWTLPSAFGRTLDELQQRDRKTWWPEIEWALVVRIQESFSTVGDTIRTLAWLRKGATPDLLARVMDLKTWDGQWDTETTSAYLLQASQLTLVKVRPRDGRLFLHDELYALLEKYVLGACSAEERDWVYTSIEQYYRDQTRDFLHTLERSPHVFPLIQPRLRQAYVEEMHYRLRHHPPLGFAMYFWLAEEALGGRDAEMDMLLRTELLRTRGWLTENRQLVDLEPAEIDIDIAMRWAMRALLLSGDPAVALRLLAWIEERWHQEIERLSLSHQHLKLYQALARIQRAGVDDWRAARELLIDVERQADAVAAAAITSPADKGRRWRARILKALALNYQGYLDRQQGSYLEAVRHYQASAMLQRRLGMTGLAGTLVNLSFAMALTGQFRHARLLAEEAERRARTNSKEHVLALALNARALVEQYDDHPRSALRYTDTALETARAVRDPRVQGLIRLNRARAYRYLWDSLTDEERKREPKLLEEALKDANQAVSLLRNVPPQQVEATIERGCIHRQIAREHHVLGRRDETDRAAAKSRRDLERVVAIAGTTDQSPQKALAWVDLGWLHYYVGQPARAREALGQAYPLVPPEYLFPAERGLPDLVRDGRKGEACLPFWSILGKAEMLSAYLALEEAKAAGRVDREDRLKQAVRHITLSLAYDEQIADEYFDLTRAEAQLHKRFLEENVAIGSLHQFAAQVADEQGLASPTRFQRFLTRIFGPAELWARA